MALASTSGAQSVISGVRAQMQQQLAERSADQAEQQARVLRTRAQAAQSVADHAQENARSLKVQSTQADNVAGMARLGLATLKSVSAMKEGLSDSYDQIGAAIQSRTTVATPSALAPVVNAFGEATGSLVNVTA